MEEVKVMVEPGADPDGPELVPMQPVRDVLKEMEVKAAAEVRDAALIRALRFTSHITKNPA